MMHDRVVLVEGGDEICLFPGIMKMVLDGDVSEIHEGPFECGSTVFTSGVNAIRFVAVGGRTKFAYAVNILLKRAEWNNIPLRSLGVVCDSDDSPAKSLNLLQDALKGAGLPVPKSHADFAGRDPTVGVFLLPDGGSGGSLDTLRRESVADDLRLRCVDDYLSCLKDLDKPAKDDDKAFVFAYSVAVGRKGDRVSSLARHGELNLAHEAFNPLAGFLKKLLLC